MCVKGSHLSTSIYSEALKYFIPKMIAAASAIVNKVSSSLIILNEN